MNTSDDSGVNIPSDIPSGAYDEVLKELYAVRQDIKQHIENASDEADLISRTDLKDWIDRESVIAFVLTDSPTMLIAGSELGPVRPGTILYATKEMHRTFRYLPAIHPDPGELTGRHVLQLAPPHLRAALTAKLAQYFQSPKRVSTDHWANNPHAYTKDGKVFPVHIALRPRRFGNRWLVLVTVSPAGPKETYVPPG